MHYTPVLLFFIAEPSSPLPLRHRPRGSAFLLLLLFEQGQWLKKSHEEEQKCMEGSLQLQLNLLSKPAHRSVTPAPGHGCLMCLHLDGQCGSQNTPEVHGYCGAIRQQLPHLGGPPDPNAHGPSAGRL